MDFSVTWISPEVKTLGPLGQLAELGQIANIDGVALKCVTGPGISRQDVARALRCRTDLILWSGHGTEGGLVMPDGSLIRPSWLATQAKASLPRLVVLAACGSHGRDAKLKSMAEEISRAGLNVVGFPMPAYDDATIRFNVELVRAMAAGAPVGAAFDVALEEISETKTAKGVFLTPGLSNGLRDVVDRLEVVERGVAEMRDGMHLILEHLGIERAGC